MASFSRCLWGCTCGLILMLHVGPHSHAACEAARVASMSCCMCGPIVTLNAVLSITILLMHFH